MGKSSTTTLPDIITQTVIVDFKYTKLSGTKSGEIGTAWLYNSVPTTISDIGLDGSVTFLPYNSKKIKTTKSEAPLQWVVFEYSKTTVDGTLSWTKTQYPLQSTPTGKSKNDGINTTSITKLGLYLMLFIQAMFG
ncbi:hypothetical protein KGF56_003606 [Candida oxycetoniae]|uniref:Uncharacterized protein n=1 Tax=Candida oxycetoniae TaxID=497107 RepID=A0AAI9SUY8_9ASCO|nr:uncharacterized protein KGF56_003606 [Candida oxycetoniae]KAI3403561.2 hypothetical protein KGF56_003606 [Candida oxycetoniae]